MLSSCGLELAKLVGKERRCRMYTKEWKIGMKAAKRRAEELIANQTYPIKIATYIPYVLYRITRFTKPVR